MLAYTVSIIITMYRYGDNRPIAFVCVLCYYFYILSVYDIIVNIS